jgi:mRNA-degrading endonuclease YafQ of YafQ-DinJ toxin-antitoxin module
MSLFKSLIIALEKDGNVPLKHKPHKLKGNYKGL